MLKSKMAVIVLYVLLSTALFSVCPVSSEVLDELENQRNSQNYLTSSCYAKYLQQMDHFDNVITDYRKFLFHTLGQMDDLCEGFSALLKPIEPSVPVPIQESGEQIPAEPQDPPSETTRILRDLLLNFNDEQFKLILLSKLSQQCGVAADKRDKYVGQKVRFHSWGGKRNNKEAPRVVIRTPFFSWGG